MLIHHQVNPQEHVIFTEVCFWKCKCQYLITGLSYGLAPNWWRAITLPELMTTQFTAPSLSLTLPVLKLEYSSQTGSIPLLLMPWFLTSPSHQQPWFWLCKKVARCLSSVRTNSIYLCHFEVSFSDRKCTTPGACLNIKTLSQVWELPC